jgi:hypothetical protein
MWSRNCLPFRGSWVHPSICWVWAARSLIFYVMCCTSLVGFGYCVVCPSIYGLWLPCWILCCLSFDLRPLITLLDIVLSVLRFTASDYRPLIYGLWLPATDLRPLITQLVSSNLSYHFIVLFMARYHRNVTDRGMQFNIIT